MKKNKYLMLILFFTLAVIVSCTDMMDHHSEYIKDGETIYSVKIDSAFIYPGNNRISIEGYMKNALQVKNIIIKWENTDKSERIETFPYDYFQFPDSFVVDIQVDEGQYLFELSSENAQGNSSIPTQVSAKVYGEKYRGYLVNRAFQNVEPNKTGGAAIIFAPPADNLVVVNFEYQTNDGTIRSLTIPSSQSELVIEDCDLSVPITYSSGYLPTEIAIDTFFCDAEVVDLEYLTDIIFEVDKSLWAIIDFSSEELPENEGGGNGSAVNIIDNNNKSYWQSEWAAQTAPLPHHITIDMKREFNVCSIDLLRRRKNNHTKTVVLESSSDGTNWEEFGTLDYPLDKTIQDVKLELTEGKRMRYIKINITESNAPPYTSLGEIYVLEPVHDLSSIQIYLINIFKFIT